MKDTRKGCCPNCGAEDTDGYGHVWDVCLDDNCLCHQDGGRWRERAAQLCHHKDCTEKCENIILIENILVTHDAERMREIEGMRDAAKKSTDVHNAVEAINRDGFRSKERSQEVLYLGHYQALSEVIEKFYGHGEKEKCEIMLYECRECHQSSMDKGAIIHDKQCSAIKSLQ